MTIPTKSKEALLTAVEMRLGRGKGSYWTNQDFELLSAAIFETTGKQLSVSTLKRIWKRTSANLNPSISTLNILAEYAGAKDWRTFSLSQQSKSGVAGKKINVRRFAMPVVLVMLAFGLYGFYHFGSLNLTGQKKAEVSFSLSKVTEGFPNTVIFEYDVGDLTYDSVMIQQSWDQTKRIPLDQPRGVVTSTYYYPGYFLAKLVVDDQIIREKALYIPTHGWQGLTGDTEGNYSYLDEEIILGETLDLEGEITLEKGSHLSLSNLLPSPVFNSRNFRMTASFRTGYSHAHSICKFVGFVVTGTREVIAFRQSRKGCVGDLNAFINKEIISGRTRDLSGLALTDQGQSDIELTILDLQVRLMINGEEVFTHRMKEDLGKIGGVQWIFEDPGEIMSLVISDGQHTWDMIRDPYFRNQAGKISSNGQPSIQE